MESLAAGAREEYSGNTSETKAMERLSGDQTACVAPVESLDTCWGSLPCGVVTQICVTPERADSKATHLPSGDQTALRLLAVSLSSGRAVPPAVGMIQRCMLFLLAAMSGV